MSVVTRPVLTGLLSTAEAAAYLGLDASTLRRYAREGIVVSLRTPGGQHRFRQSDLDAAMVAWVEPAAS